MRGKILEIILLNRLELEATGKAAALAIAESVAPRPSPLGLSQLYADHIKNRFGNSKAARSPASVFRNENSCVLMTVGFARIGFRALISGELMDMDAASGAEKGGVWRSTTGRMRGRNR